MASGGAEAPDESVRPRGVRSASVLVITAAVVSAATVYDTVVLSLAPVGK